MNINAFQFLTNMFSLGPKDAISESNPRTVDEFRARKLAKDLNFVSYYETCATYGKNVEKVFQDGKFQ